MEKTVEKVADAMDDWIYCGRCLIIIESSSLTLLSQGCTIETPFLDISDREIDQNTKLSIDELPSHFHSVSELVSDHGLQLLFTMM
jgi:hypothetical protein